MIILYKQSLVATKKMKYFILLLLISIFLVLKSNAFKCLENSSWEECAGCPLKWGGKGDCPKACNSECICDDGFVLSQDNIQCVPEKDIECPNNLQYSNNGVRATCENINLTTKSSEPGCICPENQYYYPKEKVCVEEKYCPNSTENQDCKKLDPNSEYVACTCTKTCYKQEPEYSPFCQPGCQCLEGFVWNVDKCVPTQTCP